MLKYSQKPTLWPSRDLLHDVVSGIISFFEYESCKTLAIDRVMCRA